jgi:hypothetical protein
VSKTVAMRWCSPARAARIADRRSPMQPACRGQQRHRHKSATGRGRAGGVSPQAVGDRPWTRHCDE